MARVPSDVARACATLDSVGEADGQVDRVPGGAQQARVVAVRGVPHLHGERVGDQGEG